MAFYLDDAGLADVWAKVENLLNDKVGDIEPITGTYTGTGSATKFTVDVGKGNLIFAMAAGSDRFMFVYSGGALLDNSGSIVIKQVGEINFTSGVLTVSTVSHVNDKGVVWTFFVLA